MTFILWTGAGMPASSQNTVLKRFGGRAVDRARLARFKLPDYMEGCQVRRDRLRNCGHSCNVINAGLKLTVLCNMHYDAIKHMLIS